MNHAIAGVNGGYITRHKLLEDQLRSQQQRCVFHRECIELQPNSGNQHNTSARLTDRARTLGIYSLHLDCYQRF